MLAAFATLGLDAPTTDPAVVRRAYASAVRAVHPDLHPDLRRSGEATERTVALTVAYRLVLDALAGAWTPPTPATGAGPGSGPGSARGAAPGSGRPDDGRGEGAVEGPAGPVRLLDDDTIEVDAPPDLTFSWLVQASHDFGDVTFLDRSAALLQIIVQFVDEPVCQMIFDLQGRAARGTTEIFCTIDSIEDRPAPDLVLVTRFIADHLAATIDTWD